MPLELRLLTGLALALAVVYSVTPLAIRVADRFEFYDRPVGYKAHGTPTPYLGGAAVMAGFFAAVVIFSGDWERTLPLLGGTLLMWAVGTWDDRRTVTPLVRLAIEVALAALIWEIGLGWDLGFGPAIDLAVTAFWIVAVVNAFNLFDNMDGATPSMGTVAAAGLALLGAAQGNTWLAVVGAALCGACAGFLPHNLSSPSRIFLGDGGSMPIGFAVAALTMIGVSEAAVEWQSLAMGLLFVGVPALDTTLVLISRRRRGISLLTGGRDHLTHRTKSRVQTVRAVAVALGSAQALTSALAIIALQGGSGAIVAAVVVYLMGAGVAIAVLDTRWAPVEAPTVTATGQPTAASRKIRRRRTYTALVFLVPLAIALGISPFFRGYYDSTVWVPAGLVLVVALTAGVIAFPPRLTRAAVLVLSALAALAIWSLASSLWADSIEQAVVEANRLLVYAVLTGLLLVLVRTDAAAVWLIGALAAAVLAGAAVTVVRLLGSNPADLFIAGRLDAPLGYINGQGSFHLLGFWCCIAIAEQRRSFIAAGLGLAGAAILAGVLLLSESRGLAIATGLSAAVVIALVPGRLRRVWALLVAVAAVATAGPNLVDVYDAGRLRTVPADVAHTAASSLLLAGVIAGVLWGLLSTLPQRSPQIARRLRPLAAGVVVAGLVAVLAIAAVDQADIRASVDRQYHAFTQVGAARATAPDTSSRLVSGAGNRYDYWRIAWRTWRDQPLKGIGAGNYDRAYFPQRATTEDVRQPHSLGLQTLSELGIVGALLFLAVVAGLAWGAWQLARAARESLVARFMAVAGVGCVTAWLVHTSVDWMHLLPGVTGIALAAGAVLLRERSPVAAPSPLRAPSRPRLVPAAIVAIGLALAGVSLSRQGLAEYFRSDAQDALAANPAEALRKADSSLRLDPEGVESYYVKAAAFARFNQPRAAWAALREAARREPGEYVTWALLGDLAVRTDRLGQARRYYERALALNPRDTELIEHVRDPTGATNDSN